MNFIINLRSPPEAAFILSRVPLWGDPVRKPPAHWRRQRPALHDVDEFSESRSWTFRKLWTGYDASKLILLKMLLYDKLSTGQGWRTQFKKLDVTIICCLASINAISKGGGNRWSWATVPWWLIARGSWRYSQKVCFVVTSSIRSSSSSLSYMVLPSPP